MATRRQSSEVDAPHPPFKVIAEQIAALLLVSKEVGSDQQTVQQTLLAFSRASEAARTSPNAEPF